jgi:hypothetical protein
VVTKNRPSVFKEISLKEWVERMDAEEKQAKENKPPSEPAPAARIVRWAPIAPAPTSAELDKPDELAGPASRASSCGRCLITWRVRGQGETVDQLCCDAHLLLTMMLHDRMTIEIYRGPK